MRLLRFLLLGVIVTGLAACASTGGPPTVSVGDAGHASASFMAGPCYF